MPPFQRKTLVLVGANHVGRRSMKERLIRDDPRRFGAVMPRMCLNILHHSLKRPIFFSSVKNMFLGIIFWLNLQIIQIKM